MTEDFYFKTSYNNYEDPTTYFAKKYRNGYQVVVNKGDYEATVDFTLNEVVELFSDKSWVVVFDKENV